MRTTIAAFMSYENTYCSEPAQHHGLQGQLRLLRGRGEHRGQPQQQGDCRVPRPRPQAGAEPRPGQPRTRPGGAGSLR